MKGNQIPRIRIEPPRSATDGTGAAMLMQAYGVTLDEWQRLVLDSWLGTDPAGQYTVTSAGLSVPRQNGKNCIVEARELYGLVVNGERILHTAHQVRTAKKAFRRLVNIFTDKKHPEIVNAVKKIRYGIGEESIELNNGGIERVLSLLSAGLAELEFPAERVRFGSAVVVKYFATVVDVNIAVRGDGAIVEGEGV